MKGISSLKRSVGWLVCLYITWSLLMLSVAYTPSLYHLWHLGLNTLMPLGSTILPQISGVSPGFLPVWKWQWGRHMWMPLIAPPPTRSTTTSRHFPTDMDGLLALYAPLLSGLICNDLVSQNECFFISALVAEGKARWTSHLCWTKHINPFAAAVGFGGLCWVKLMSLFLKLLYGQWKDQALSLVMVRSKQPVPVTFLKVSHSLISW